MVTKSRPEKYVIYKATVAPKDACYDPTSRILSGPMIVGQPIRAWMLLRSCSNVLLERSTTIGGSTQGSGLSETSNHRCRMSSCAYLRQNRSMIQQSRVEHPLCRNRNGPTSSCLKAIQVRHEGTTTICPNSVPTNIFYAHTAGAPPPYQFRCPPQ